MKNNARKKNISGRRKRFSVASSDVFEENISTKNSQEEEVRTSRIVLKMAQKFPM